MVKVTFTKALKIVCSSLSDETLAVACDAVLNFDGDCIYVDDTRIDIEDERYGELRRCLDTAMLLQDKVVVFERARDFQFSYVCSDVKVIA